MRRTAAAPSFKPDEFPAIFNDQRGLVVKEKQTATFALAKPKGDLVDKCVDIVPMAGENEISLAAFNAPNTVQSFMDTATFTSTRNPDESHLYILSVCLAPD